MSLRIMLPSRAKVGDTIHFAFPNVPGRVISGFEVTINGARITEPTVLKTRTPKGGTANFVFKVEEAGTYHFEVIPIDEAGQRSEPRLNTLEVPSQSFVALE